MGGQSHFLGKKQYFWHLITHNTHISKLRSILLFSFEYLSSAIPKNMVTLKNRPNGIRIVTCHKNYFMHILR